MKRLARALAATWFPAAASDYRQLVLEMPREPATPGAERVRRVEAFAV